VDGAEITEALGTSHRRPSATVLWTMDPLDILGELVRFLPRKRGMEDMQALLKDKERPIKIPPGMVMVAFDSGIHDDTVHKEPHFAAIIPVHSRRGNRVWAGTLAKGIKKLLERMKIPVEKTSRTRMIVGSNTAHIDTRRGLVFIATNLRILDEMMAGEGTPWVSESLKGMASGTALAIEMRIEPTRKTPATDIRAGLGLSKGLWDIQLQVDMQEVENKGIAGMLSTMLSLRPELKDKMAQELLGDSPLDIVRGNVQTLSRVEQGYLTEHDIYLAAGPWPRRVEDLTPEPYPWTPAEEKKKTRRRKRTATKVSIDGFEKLDWRPMLDPSATYWVEVSKDGTTCTAFGAIDSDGDGQPAIFKASQETQFKAVRVSPEGVR